jgi:predicted nucleotidyltransferase
VDVNKYRDSQVIKDFCQKHHIRRMSFFGSILRDDFGLESDIDVLVEFEPGHTPGFDFFLMEAELSRLLGRKVDLVTENFLSPKIRHSVLAEAVIVCIQEWGSK